MTTKGSPTAPALATSETSHAATGLVIDDEGHHHVDLILDFKVVRHANREREIEQYLDAGRARVGLTIPVDFSRDLRGGRVTQLPVIVDGSDSNTATIALGYFAALTELYGRRISPVPVKTLIEVRARVWYNPELKSRNFIVPGLIAVIMMVIAALLTSLCIAREWERGTMEQLIATPVDPRAYSGEDDTLLRDRYRRYGAFDHLGHPAVGLLTILGIGGGRRRPEAPFQ